MSKAWNYSVSVAAYNELLLSFLIFSKVELKLKTIQKPRLYIILKHNSSVTYRKVDEVQPRGCNRGESYNPHGAQGRGCPGQGASPSHTYSYTHSHTMAS